MSSNSSRSGLITAVATVLFGTMALPLQAQPSPAAVTIDAPEIQGRLKQIQIETIATSTSEAHWQAVVVLENTGKVDFRPYGAFEILDARGNVLQTIEFPSRSVPRESDQRFVFPMKSALAAGNYTLLARVGLGNGEVQQIAVDIVIDKPSSNAAKVQADYPVPIFSQR